jgi:heme-degrading monooxygenase HmoA
MYIIMWEYRVKEERCSDFELLYSSNGDWAQLFSRGTGFISVELLRDEASPQRYLTIDRWRSKEEYETFLARWGKEYKALDVRCEDLTEGEALMGKWGYI